MIKAGRFAIAIESFPDSIAWQFADGFIFCHTIIFQLYVII